MAASSVTGLTIVKAFSYRDNPAEEWSSKYHFAGAVPATPSSWETLAESVLTAEVSLLTAAVQAVRAYGYDSNDPKANHVWTIEYAPGQWQGVATYATGVRAAGDQAACIQWLTDVKSSKGKPVYLRKYMHDCYLDPADHDKLFAGYVTNAEAYATTMDSIHNGLLSFKMDSVPRQAISHEVIPWVTTRTLKRRGKRPKVSP
jgi:hypothetical protein